MQMSWCRPHHPSKDTLCSCSANADKFHYAGCVEALAEPRALRDAFWTLHRPPSEAAAGLALRCAEASASWHSCSPHQMSIGLSHIFDLQVTHMR